PVNEYKVLLELAPQYQADPSALSLLYFKATPQGGGAGGAGAAGGVGGGGGGAGAAGGAAGGGAAGGIGIPGAQQTNGTVVPLDTLAHVTQVVGPQTVSHKGQLTAVTVSFNLAPGASLGGVLTKVREIAAATVPEGVNGQFEG